MLWDLTSNKYFALAKHSSTTSGLRSSPIIPSRQSPSPVTSCIEKNFSQERLVLYSSEAAVTCKQGATGRKLDTCSLTAPLLVTFLHCFHMVEWLLSPEQYLQKSKTSEIILLIAHRIYPSLRSTTNWIIRMSDGERLPLGYWTHCLYRTMSAATISTISSLEVENCSPNIVHKTTITNTEAAVLNEYRGRENTGIPHKACALP